MNWRLAEESMLEDKIDVADSRAVRVALCLAGFVCVALGIVGAFLPVMPTTCFLCLAAACFARSSSRFYQRLISTPGVGPLIRDFRRHGVIPRRAKVMAICTIAPTITISAIAVDSLPVALLLVAVGLAVSLWIARHPHHKQRQS